jgi:DNA-binding IclR family transcriptional regulator
MKTLNRALAILEVFLQVEEDGIRLSELARLSGLNKATANRIVSDLVKQGYLYQPKPRGKYHLGTKFLRFHQLIMQKSKLEQVAPPYLTKLAESVGDCVLMSVLDDEQTLVTNVVDSDHVLRIALEVGVRIPLYCTGQGKALLAGMTEAELDQYISKVALERLTDNTITSPSELKLHLKTVVEEGVAYDDEDRFIGIRNVAVGIRNAAGKVFAAVGVIGPSVWMTRERMREIAPQVKECAAEISRALGYASCDTEPTADKPKAQEQEASVAQRRYFTCTP